MKIFIYATAEGFSYFTASLIQGLLALGHEVSTNCASLDCDGRLAKANLHKLGRIEIAKHDNSEDVLIVDERRPLGVVGSPKLGSLYDELLVLRQKKPVGVVYIQDDANFACFPQEIPVFMAHVNRFMNKGCNVIPVGFGAPHELFQLADEVLALSVPRQSQVVANFNPTFSQSVRESMYLAFEKRLASFFPVDYSPAYGEAYAKRLATNLAILSYGGVYYWPVTDYEHFQRTMSPEAKGIHEFSNRGDKVAVFRWDSFRLWEAFVFGCAPITLDLNKYGHVLPVMPEPWVHYIPLGLDCLSEDLETLRRLFSCGGGAIESMGRAARQWVREHYSPEAVAGRCLASLGC